MRYAFNAFEPLSVSANAIGFVAGAGLPAGFRVYVSGSNLSYDAATGTLSGDISYVSLWDYSGPFPRSAQTITIQPQNAGALAQDITAFLQKALFVQTEAFSAWDLESLGLASFGATSIISDTLADLELLDAAGQRIGFLRLHGSGLEGALADGVPASSAPINQIELLDAAGKAVAGKVVDLDAGWTLAHFNYAARTLDLTGAVSADGLYDVIVSGGVTISTEPSYAWLSTTGGAGNDSYLYGNGLHVDYSNVTAGVAVDLAQGHASGGGGNDTWVAGGSAGATGSAFADTITGGSIVNVLSGGGGSDVLVGQGLTDIMDGGTGDDTIDGGGGDDWIVGGAGDDVIHGGSNAGSNFDAGHDTDDILTFSHVVLPIQTGVGTPVIWRFLSTRDFNTEAPDAGITVDFTDSGSGSVSGSATGTDTFDGIEHVFGSSGNDVFNASAAGNVFTGMGGDDTFNGGAGPDTANYDLESYEPSVRARVLAGTVASGAIVNLSGDARTIDGVTLLAGTARDLLGGIDSLFSVEIVDGSALDDKIIGGAGAETLAGGAGYDVLAGGAGNDVIWGAARGTSSGGTIFDIADYRLDGGSSAISVVVAEDGSASVIDTFGATDTLNTIGTIAGTDGDDVFVGSSHSDRFAPNGGNDTITGGGADAGPGGDQLTYLTNDAATGGIAYDGLSAAGQIVSLGSGSDWGNDTLIGFSKIWLEATQNADDLKGGDGDDVFLASLGNDVIDGRGGVDALLYIDAKSTAANVGIQVTAIASEAHAGTVDDAGGATDTYQGIEMVGGTMHADVFNGAGFDDTFAGFAGNDTFVGGGGFDTVSYAFDAGHAAALGFDLRQLNGDTFSSSIHGIAVNMVTGRVTGLWEDLGTTVQEDTDTLIGITKVIGTQYNDNFIGNDLANAFDGGAGGDDMTGGGGNDTYYVDSESDKIREASGPAGGIDTVVSTISYSLSDYLDHVENLTLSGAAVEGTGNHATNTITGNDNANILNGLGGNDTLTGGVGADVFRFYASYVTLANSFVPSLITTAAGRDRITDFETHASGGGDVIDLRVVGIASFVTLLALIKDVNGNAVLNVNTRGLRALELTIETVQRGSLSAADFLLTPNTSARNLTGDSLANDLFGSLGNDTLFGANGNDRLFGEKGNDKLTGGAGNDSMYGGAGSDTYYVDSRNDRVDELLSGSDGTDEVRATVSYSLADTRHVFGRVEKLTLEGNAITGTGNSLANTITGNARANSLSGGAGNDTIIGGSGSDTLNGGSGVDIMRGGNGDDVYFVDDVRDIVDESGVAGGAGDYVISTISFNLSDRTHVKGKIEALTLAGTRAINGTGDAAANIIEGNAANNRISGLGGDDFLDGGDGRDRLTGGAGGDAFFFTSALNATRNVDTIVDFDVKRDGIVLLGSIFKGVPYQGPDHILSISAFKANASGTATDTDDRIVYNTRTGALFYDSNGSASGGSVQFAVLANKANLSYIDFVVI